MALHIVLFEPEIPQNTGNIARTCVAIDATLHLVHPLGFSLSEKQVRRSALDYWPHLHLVEHSSIDAFFEAEGDKNLYFFTTKAQRAYTEVAYEEDVYFIFGKESAGVDEAILLKNPSRCVRIPMRGEIRSLNLSNSVAVAAYEWERQMDFKSLQNSGSLHHHRWGEKEMV